MTNGGTAAAAAPRQTWSSGSSRTAGCHRPLLCHAYISNCILIFCHHPLLCHTYISNCILIFCHHPLLCHTYISNCILIFCHHPLLCHTYISNCILIFCHHPLLCHTYISNCILIFCQLLLSHKNSNDHRECNVWTKTTARLLHLPSTHLWGTLQFCRPTCNNA